MLMDAALSIKKLHDEKAGLEAQRAAAVEQWQQDTQQLQVGHCHAWVWQGRAGLVLFCRELHSRHRTGHPPTPPPVPNL